MFSFIQTFFAAMASARIVLHSFPVHHLPFIGFLPVQSGLRHRFGGGTSDIAHTGAGVSLRCGHVTDVTVIPEYPGISQNIQPPVSYVIMHFAPSFLPSPAVRVTRIY